MYLKKTGGMIGTDANASIGVSAREDERIKNVGRCGISHINDSGRTFLSCENLFAFTTMFQKKSYGTWIHLRSKKPHQLDHFIGSHTTRSRVIDAGVTEQLIDSDHRAVKCKLRVMLKLRKKTTAC